MKIVFWSPFKGRCATTSSMLTLSSNLALSSGGLSSCVWSANYADNFQTPLLGKDSETMLKDSVSTFGLDALLRDAKGSNLSKSNIEDAALELSSKYSVFIAASNRDKRITERALNANAIDILNALNAIYPLVFVDTRGGFSVLNQEILAEADLIVVCLNQSSRLIENTFERCKFDLQNCMFLITDYDSSINVSPRNLQKKFKEVTTKNSAVIPHCADLANAMNNGSLFKWIALNQKCKPKDPNYRFHKELNAASMKLLKLLQK